MLENRNNDRYLAAKVREDVVSRGRNVDGFTVSDAEADQVLEHVDWDAPTIGDVKGALESFLIIRANDRREQEKS